MKTGTSQRRCSRKWRGSRWCCLRCGTVLRLGRRRFLGSRLACLGEARDVWTCLYGVLNVLCVVFYVLSARLKISWIENAQKKRRRYAKVYFAFGQALLENAIARLGRYNKTMMIPLLTLPRRPSQAVALMRTDEAELEDNFNAAWDVLRVDLTRGEANGREQTICGSKWPTHLKFHHAGSRNSCVLPYNPFFFLHVLPYAETEPLPLTTATNV